jgi:hypothetical protein
MGDPLVFTIWLLPLVAMLFSALAGLCLWLNLKIYKAKKIKSYRQSKIKGGIESGFH